VLFLAQATEHFDGFHGLSYLLLVAGFVALALWLAAFGFRWLQTRPDLPGAGPELNEIPENPESPAVVNFLVNNWRVTSSGISATMVDLAARRILGLDLVGHDDTVVRLRDAPARGALTPYETQVYALLQARATNGSAPIEAIKLDEDEAEGWTRRCKKAVIAEARAQGLARRRWEIVDYLVVGIGLAFVLGFFALALGVAHVGRSSTSSDNISPGDWLSGGAFAWFAAMALVTRSQAVTDTPAGKRACARWLGMRNYFRHSNAFDNQPPASVAIWDRLLAYGVATGAARDAARGLPIVAEDTHTAWTRSTGTWREIRIEYPERFGFGQKPLNVFAGGVVRALFWGGIAYVALPVVTVVGWQILRDALGTAGTNSRDVNLLIAFIAILVTVVGLYLSARTFGGVMRLVRGAMDLGRTETIEGEVVKLHRGRFAIDDGHRESAVALFVPPAPPVARGQRVRAVISPHLHHLSSLTVIKDVAGSDSSVAASALPGSMAAAFASLGGTMSGLSTDALQSATGFALRPAQARSNSAGGAVLPFERFADGQGNELNIAVLPAAAAASPLLSAVAKFATRGGTPVPNLGKSATWTRDRALIVTTDERTLVVDVEFPQTAPGDRLAAAEKVARLLLSPADNSGALSLA
jgi:hypothetical protein